MKVVPLTLKQANEVILRIHRHHKPVQGHRFSIGAMKAGQLVGVAVVGRMTDPYKVAEVTRLATDGTKNACSILYAACARAAQAMGFETIQTFILESEPGTTLRASGWELSDSGSRGGSWVREGRPRRTDQPMEAKRKYVRFLNAAQPAESGGKG